MISGMRWVVVLLLGSGFLAVREAQTLPSMSLRVPLESAVPLDLLGFTGAPVEVREAERRSARAPVFLARGYTLPGARTDAEPEAQQPAESFEVHVCYYPRKDSDKWLYAPRLCHQEPAWSLIWARIHPIPLEGGARSVNSFLVQRDRQRAAVLFWYQGRGHVEANTSLVRWNLFRDALLRSRSDEALVRVFVPIQESEERAFQLAEEVAKQIIPKLQAALPSP